MVQVHAASLNPADWKRSCNLRLSATPFTASARPCLTPDRIAASAGGEQAALLSFRWPRVFGFDFSGVVEAVPTGESEWSVGESVFGEFHAKNRTDQLYLNTIPAPPAQA